MGAKQPKIHNINGRYMGNLTRVDTDVLDSIIQLKKENGVLPSLVNTIYNIPEEEVQRAISQRDFNFKDKPLGSLTANQTLGVGFLYYSRECILGDSVGLGKTVQASALINILTIQSLQQESEFKCLYLTEKRLLGQAQRELVKFTAQRVLIAEATAVKASKWRENVTLEDLDVVVAPHSSAKQQIFLSWLNDESKRLGKSKVFDLLIIDESSILGNSTSDMFRDMKNLKKFCNRLILMNATPFENKLDVFYNQLDFLDKKLLPTKTDFAKKYKKFDHIRGYGYFKNEYQNADEFRDLISYHYFWNTRKNLGAQIINSSIKLLTRELTPQQKELLKETSMPDLVYDCPNEVTSEYIEFSPDTVPKLDMLEEVLQQVEGQVLVFSHYKSTHLGIARHLECNWEIDCEYLNGDTSQEESDDIIRRFQNDEFKVLVTNIKKGINFGNCNNVVFYSYSTNPNQMIQMEGRVTRSFDIINKNLFILCMEGREKKNLVDKVAKTMNYSKDFSMMDTSIIGEYLIKLFEGDEEDA